MAVSLETVMTAFYNRMIQVVSVPLIYPGTSTNPPDTGAWVELDVLPNDPIHRGLALDDQRVDQGILQAAVVSRASPNGYFALAPIAKTIMESFPIGYNLTTGTRVTQEPAEMRVERQSPDRIMLVVSIRYMG